jgi:hypothetical protein
MSGGFDRKPGGESLVHQTTEARAQASGPGKRTLTEQLPHAPGAAASSSNVPAKADAAGSGGGPLPSSLRGELEPALGAGLSSVRVHTGPESAAAADGLQARAYATGQDIHFAQGAYDPASPAGRHLIAHEVAHTVQQQGATATVQRSATVSTPGDPAERQANAFAGAFVSGQPTDGIVTRGLQSSTSIHRFGRDEHADLATTHLTALYAYLRTPEGKKWAKDHGYQDPEALIRRMAADPVIQADSAPGDGKKEPAKLKGAKTSFTYGEVTALMGDLFGHWESLYNADEDQRSHLMGEDTTANNEKYTKGEYLKLAAKNDSHFAGENSLAWLQHHEKALDLARDAGADEDKFNQALFIDAAGGHFLTDAFSAGHQFEKKVVMTAVQLDLKKQPLQTQNPQLQLYVFAADQDDPQNLANLIVKNIHDRMNEEGFEVSNDKGMTWKTLGDGYLATSPETQRIAALALFESRQQVIAAHNAKTRPNPQEVLAFFPNEKTRAKANLQALAYIPEARKQVEALLYSQRTEAKAKLGNIGGYLVEHNLEAIGDPARENDLLRQQDFDRAHGGNGNVPMSQFEWRF